MRCSSLGNAQVEFEHHRAVAHEVMLEGADLLEAMLPDILAGSAGRQVLPLQQVRMHPHRQHLLVMGAVEDSNAATGGNVLTGPPQKIVRQLFGTGCFERMHFAALRIDAGHHMLDHAVLAGRIHALEHHQHAPLPLGVKPLLQFLDPGNAVGEHRLDVRVVGGKAEAFRRIVIGELEMPRLVDAAMLDDLGEVHGRLVALFGHFTASIPAPDKQPPRAACSNRCRPARARCGYRRARDAGRRRYGA